MLFFAFLVKKRGMFFTVSKVLAFLLEPLVHPYLLLGIALVLRWRRRRRAMRACLALAVMLPLAYGLLPLSTPPLQWLENSHSVPALDRGNVDGIIVLGGHTSSGQLSERRNQAQQNQAADRLTKGLMLHREHAGSTLIFTGFSGKLVNTGWSEAETTRRIVAELGVPEAGIIYETTSRNTYQNAVNSLDVAVPQPGSRWILVTSAAHMPRAMGAFEAAGWKNITPYPVDFRTTPLETGMFSLQGGINNVRNWLHEYVGLAVYWLTGRSTILFP